MRNLNIAGPEFDGKHTIPLGSNEYGEQAIARPNLPASAGDEFIMQTSRFGAHGTDYIPSGLPKHRFHFSAESNEQDNSSYIWAVNGTDSETPNHVEVDEVPTPEGRWLFFKNSLQHRVTRIYNSSSTEVATRKILLFWLVNPMKPIESTQDVPHQNFDEFILPVIIEALEPRVGHSTALKIAEDARWGQTVEQAQEIRLALMAERSNKQQDEGNGFEKAISTTHQFNFCEH